MSNQSINVSVPEGTRIRIGVPAEQPDAAIAALKNLFASKPNVQHARLGLMEMLFANGASQFSYTIGIYCEDNQEATEQEIMQLLQTVPAGRWPISIVPLTDQYFTKESIVFYRSLGQPKNEKPEERGWFSRLFGK